MIYRIIVSPRAILEIEAAIDFYTLHSSDAPKKFIDELSSVYRTLEQNPFKRVRYKNIRAISLEKFPYSLYFVVYKNKKVIKVLSCFHHKRNPANRPA